MIAPKLLVAGSLAGLILASLTGCSGKAKSTTTTTVAGVGRGSSPSTTPSTSTTTSPSTAGETPTSTGSVPEPQVVSDCRTPGIRPAQIILSCGDASQVAQAIHWSAWGPWEATGSTTVGLDDCRPSCALGQTQHYAATITLFDEAVSGGVPYFLHAQLTWTSTAPAHIPSPAVAGLPVPGPVNPGVDLVAGPQVKAALEGAFAAEAQLPTAAVAGTAPGTVFYAWDRQNDSYWAVAGMQPAPGLSARQMSAFSGGPAVFTHVIGDNWQVESTTSLGSACPALVPAAVLAAWAKTPPACNFPP